jgi:hypothetical protein
MTISDTGLFEFFTELIVLLVGAWAVALALRLVKRTRPDLTIGLALTVAFAVRIVAARGVGQLGVAGTLRGGDELTFFQKGLIVSQDPIGSSTSLDKLTSQLHTFLISVDFRIFGDALPKDVVRFQMVALAVLGLLFLSAAVYELAGPKAALIAAWILALEPTNVFFSGIIHKESLMFLAEGLVAFGGATLWKRGNFGALVPLVLGCLIAIATRPYAGWFLAAAAAAIVLHAALTRHRGLRSLALTSAVVLGIAAFIPVVWNASSDKNLKSLQASQDANAADTQANLSLERVDYSTRENLILNMPQRVYDVVFRPYIWETENLSQQLGVMGTLVVLACLALLAQALARNRRAIMQRAGPLVYPALFMLAAYALSAGNAGTAFRYRTHVVGLALCLLIVLRAHRKEEAAAARQRVFAPRLLRPVTERKVVA